MSRFTHAPSIRNVLFMIASWILAANLYYVLRLAGIGEASSIQVLRPFNIKMLIFEATTTGLLVGVVFSMLDILLSGHFFRKKPYGLLLLLKSLSFLITLLLTISIVFIVSQSIFKGIVIEEAFWRLGIFYSNWSVYTIILYAVLVSIAINFIKLVSRKFGPGVLSNLLKGKYHIPQEEERIFMFLDLKASTTYAEKLGHIRYSQLIQDCFYDLTDVVHKCHAQIYQYVGDEAVLTWSVQEGLPDGKCMECFFEFENILQQRAPHYLEKFGFVPQFKAGLNMGLVTVAEVGEIKREIAYHGDVLNTAARIQGKCNELSERILISESLKQSIMQNNRFKTNLLGSVLLKGKLTSVNIYSVQRLHQPAPTKPDLMPA
ncbi:adenylate/guanylate cyclase domain-containing protein [Rhodocytophaga rosea]|uniref:Adenylate/guanylate cyclase domain-containing protein n=1 Tax=Rhodocytophaga rosea TaxID=2704465 RepID=A0A6C0GU50_9BACT|nr:adenylate/guanylate cyclase domain-containing protein [Rhodocytophaga rosea]QHT71447.1 adenylate/guanylate cyclase domain-containing protein [Rhodocytophaga rosea]